MSVAEILARADPIRALIVARQLERAGDNTRELQEAAIAVLDNEARQLRAARLANRRKERSA